MIYITERNKNIRTINWIIHSQPRIASDKGEWFLLLMPDGRVFNCFHNSRGVLLSVYKKLICNRSDNMITYQFLLIRRYVVLYTLHVQNHFERSTISVTVTDQYLLCFNSMIPVILVKISSNLNNRPLHWISADLSSVWPCGIHMWAN